ncbi:hypothetical protein FIU89_00885 [Roseovarius sp. THAF27]|uniref:hypothetical protein n=1 Tax=unclassified Roseovarius TaxID=2614913 RepID=UPI0012693DB0|nr:MULTISPECIES: hypothetical protein [unclassified Roseovarius]QFT79147.1 hypothetical protein FIU89_00885 [Roseovarius sp. THAF27]QFT97698.1 hypothetical protein FIU85_10320 [Roseovarius sp. THAF8]
MLVSLNFDGSVDLDLVAHFLGIATHDNINAAPSRPATARTASYSPLDIAPRPAAAVLGEQKHLKVVLI